MSDNAETLGEALNSNSFLLWLFEQPADNLATFLSAITVMPPIGTGEGWRKKHLTQIEKYFISNGFKDGSFEQVRVVLLKYFALFDRKDFKLYKNFKNDELSQNRLWSVFVAGWLAQVIRTAISYTPNGETKKTQQINIVLSKNPFPPEGIRIGFIAEMNQKYT